PRLAADGGPGGLGGLSGPSGSPGPGGSPVGLAGQDGPGRPEGAAGGPEGLAEAAGTGGTGAAAARLLRAAGVRIAAGSGALRDAAGPVGRGDPLEAAFLLASQARLGAADAYEAVSGSARAALGLPPVRVEAGFPAELLAVRGEGLEAVLSLAYSRVVVHRGRVVARTSAVREYCDSAAVAALDLPRQSRSRRADGPGPGSGPGAQEP
ncbi:hydrolase, partial [Streptomyces sp. URMC 123]